MTTRNLMVAAAFIFSLTPLGILAGPPEAQICCVLKSDDNKIAGCVPYTTIDKCTDLVRQSGASTNSLAYANASCEGQNDCFVTPPTVNLNVQLPGFASKEFSGGINSYIKAIVALLIYLAAFLSLFMIVWGGFKWLWGAGSEELIGSAKKTIINAIMGLLLALGSYLILQIINPHLTDFTGIQPIKLAPMIIGGGCQVNSLITKACFCGEAREASQDGYCCWRVDPAVGQFKKTPSTTACSYSTPGWCNQVRRCVEYIGGFGEDANGGPPRSACMGVDPCNIGPCKLFSGTCKQANGSSYCSSGTDCLTGYCGSDYCTTGKRGQNCDLEDGNADCETGLICVDTAGPGGTCDISGANN